MLLGGLNEITQVEFLAGDHYVINITIIDNMYMTPRYKIYMP